jgi:hypothetical protein
LADYFRPFAVTLQSFGVGDRLIRLPAWVFLAGLRGSLEVLVQDEELIAGLCTTFAQSEGAVLENGVQGVVPVVSLGYCSKVLFRIKELEVEQLQLLDAELFNNLRCHVHARDSRVCVVVAPVENAPGARPAILEFRHWAAVWHTAAVREHVGAGWERKLGALAFGCELLQ